MGGKASRKSTSGGPGTTSQSPHYCGDLSPEARAYALQLRARGLSIDAVKSKIEKAFPEDKKYVRASWGYLLEWSNEELQPYLDEARAGAQGKFLANKDSRILALVQIAEDLLQEVLKIDWKGDHKRGVEITREFRLTLEDIRKETGPLGIEDPIVRSAWESFVGRMNQAPDEMRERLGWNSSSQQTPVQNN